MRALSDAELDVVSGGEWKKSYHKPGAVVIKDNLVQVAVDTGDIYKNKIIAPHADYVIANYNTGNQAIVVD